jgi:hypothetical protein
MKKVLFFLTAMFMVSFIAFSQTEPGIATNNGGGINKSPIANGLSQLYSVSGAYTLSADGAGSGSANYTISVNKPNAGATVHKAYLLCAPVWFNSGNCTQLNGQAITWGGSSPSAWGCCNYYADVTSIVAPILNPASPGITNIPIYECNYIDGYALLVIFSDPLAVSKTIVIMFGGLSTTGDNFSITLGEPIDPSVPGALLTMGLGISYSYQGSGQYSIVDVNGQRLTTSAGGQDDGFAQDGALMTVGGIGDAITNPPNPYAIPSDTRSDDELYSLLPLITNTTTSILVNTSNPSNNDNIFLSYFEISGVAVIGEGVLLTQTSTSGPVGSNHLVTAHVVNDLGAPVPGKVVTFTILSGPNAGATGSAPSDVNGLVTFNYTGTGGVGSDVIQACITTPTGTICSNNLTFEWTTGTVGIPTLSQWGLIFLGLALLAFGTFYILKMRA